ncbi:unnamed protein product [Calypogeia fissa]
MGKIGGRRTILFASAVALFVLQFSGLIQAIHITTYTKEDCTGSVVSHMDAVEGECYHARGSNKCGRVIEATTNQQTSFFVAGDCKGQKVGTANGNGLDVKSPNGQIHSVHWKMVAGHSPVHTGHSPGHHSPSHR